MICPGCAWRWGFRMRLFFHGLYRHEQVWICSNGHEWLVTPPRW